MKMIRFFQIYFAVLIIIVLLLNIYKPRQASFAEPRSVYAQTSPILTKTAYEMLDISLDFTNRAQNGITVDTVTAVRLSNGADATTSLIVNTPDTPIPTVPAMTNKVLFRVKGGTLGDQYTVAVRVTKIDTSEKLEGTITVKIVSTQ